MKQQNRPDASVLNGMKTQLLTCTAIAGPDFFPVEGSVVIGLEMFEIHRYYLEFSNGLSGTVYAIDEAILDHIPLNTPHLYKVGRSKSADRRASVRPYALPVKDAHASTVEHQHPASIADGDPATNEPSASAHRNTFLRDIVLGELDGLVRNLEQAGLNVNFETERNAQELSHLEIQLMSLLFRIRAFLDHDEGPYTSAWCYNVLPPMGSLPNTTEGERLV